MTLGIYWGNIGIMEKNMETTILHRVIYSPDRASRTDPANLGWVSFVGAVGLHMHPTSIYEGHGLLKEKYVVPHLWARSPEDFSPQVAKGT